MDQQTVFGIVLISGVLVLGGVFVVASEPQDTSREQGAADVAIIESESGETATVVVQSLGDGPRDEYVRVPASIVVDTDGCVVRWEECWLVAQGDRVTVETAESFTVESVRDEKSRVVAEYPSDSI